MSEPICITEETYYNLRDDNGGICTSCHSVSYSCEPDARNYRCENCDEYKVFGIEELLLTGDLTLVEDEEDDNVEF